MIPVVKIVDTRFAVSNFMLGYGRVVYNYLAEGAKDITSSN